MANGKVSRSEIGRRLIEIEENYESETTKMVRNFVKKASIGLVITGALALGYDAYRDKHSAYGALGACAVIAGLRTYPFKRSEEAPITNAEKWRSIETSVSP